MSGTMNTCVLVGRVGKDPEVRHTTKGDKVVSFSLATDRWKKGEPPDWHNVVVFGKAADFAAEYITKGSTVAVKGAIRYEAWEKDGQKRTATKINAEGVTLVGGGRSKDEPADNALPGEEELRRLEKAPFVAGDEDVPFTVLIAPLAAALLGVIA